MIMSRKPVFAKALADERGGREREKESLFNFKHANLWDTYLIHDLWHHEALGEFKGPFTITLPPHGTGLYRVHIVR